MSKKIRSGFFFLEIATYKVFVYKLYMINRYKSDLALNNQQELICYKTQPSNQPTKSSNSMIFAWSSICFSIIFSL